MSDGFIAFEFDRSYFYLTYNNIISSTNRRGQMQTEAPPPARHSRFTAHYYKHVASAKMTSVLCEAIFLNHGVLLLHITINMCPAEFVDIFEAMLKT